MKICFISPKAYPLFNSKIKSTFGGAEVQLSLLAKELTKNKEIDVHFMVADYGQKDIEKIENVTIWKSINFKKNNLLESLNFFKIFNKINADVYAQRTLTIQSGLIALYCKLINKRFIYMVAHDDESDKTNEIYKSILGQISSKLLFNLSDKIIVQNEYQKKNILKNFNKNSFLLKSSYEIKAIKNQKKDFILWVGRSEDWKRPELFIKLAKLNPNFSFVMICPQSTKNPGLSIEVEKEACKIKNIKFYSFVPFDSIDIFFKNAKLFVNTSFQEGFPNTFIQATKNKTPILSLTVNPDSIINKFEIGYVCDNDFNKLSNNLIKILKNKIVFDKMSKNAFKYANDNHNIKVNSKKFLEIVIK